MFLGGMPVREMGTRWGADFHLLIANFIRLLIDALAGSSLSAVSSTSSDDLTDDNFSENQVNSVRV